jgi:hypothetical protein
MRRVWRWVAKVFIGISIRGGRHRTQPRERCPVSLLGGNLMKSHPIAQGRLIWAIADQSNPANNVASVIVSAGFGVSVIIASISNLGIGLMNSV